MSKSSLKRSGPKEGLRDVDSPTRHASKKRKLEGGLKKAAAQEADKTTNDTAGTEEIGLQSDDETAAASGAPVLPESNQADSEDKKRRKSRSKSKTKHDSRTKWQMTSTTGGRFLQLDPLFVDGDKQLILATKDAIHVYSTSTSLLVRSLIPANESNITSYALSPSNPEILYVGTFSGHISKWDWSSGKLVSAFAGPSDLLGLVPAPAETLEDYAEFMYAIHRTGDKEKSASFLRVRKDGTTQIQSLFERRFLSREMYLTSDGKVLVLTAGQKLIIGAVHLLAKAKGTTKDVTFREVTLPEDISSFDVRERSKSTSTKSQDPALDIVVGTRRGPMLLYDDVYGKLLAKERLKDNAINDLIPRRLHWHRDVVNFAKWSRDGNYVISGGKETVLVIWQLDTQQKQFLPHLTAELLSLSVSPAGTSYSITLSNNTNIVLSTSELRPTASLSGLDLPGQSLGKDKKRRARRSVAVISGDRPEEILLVSSSMLQTFDTRTQQNISRQALTRNNVTNVNINPTGTSIQDPVVNHMAISRDNMWLATVDEWAPPAEDMDSMWPRQSSSDDKREVYLKFWIYDATEKTWQLSSRIDGPYSEADNGHGSVVQLVSNPSRLEFATFGNDGNLSVWSPRARTRNGQPVTNKSGRRLLDWSCRYTLRLSDASSSTTNNASLAFSEDGSVIAASIFGSSQPTQSSVILVDNVSGTIQSSLPTVTSSATVRLAILGPYLVTLSSHLAVYDLVRQILVYSIPITTAKRHSDPASEGFLSVDYTSRSIAVAFPLDLKFGHIAQTQIAIFNPEQPRPLYQCTGNYNITSLLPEPGRGGFVVIDDDAVIRKFQSTALSGKTTAGTTTLSEPEMKLGLADMFGSSRRSKTTDTEGITSAGAIEEAPRTQESISDLFGNRRPDQAGLTPVTQLFNVLARNLVGKEKKLDA